MCCKTFFKNSKKCYLKGNLRLKKDFEDESGDFNDSEKEEKSLETIITKESEKPAK